LDAEQRDYLESVDSSAQSLLTIIDDILDFSKIEAGRTELESIPFSLRECVETAGKKMLPEAHAKQLALSTMVAPEAPDTLAGDPGRLRQVLLNLLGNAVKFTPRGLVDLSVTVDTADESAVALHFVVRDTGIGIPADKQSFLFEPFRQADGSVTRKYGGTGLGLAISARLVKMMGGRIWLESSPDRGSTFHFTANFSRTLAPIAPGGLAGQASQPQVFSVSAD
jgi:protein-histidine pros-kinase